jgi:hypothetical protein
MNVIETKQIFRKKKYQKSFIFATLLFKQGELHIFIYMGRFAARVKGAASQQGERVKSEELRVKGKVAIRCTGGRYT